MTPTLRSKLAAIVDYLEGQRSRMHNVDTAGLSSYLDDIEVMNWLDGMRATNSIDRSRFINENGGRTSRYG